MTDSSVETAAHLLALRSVSGLGDSRIAALFETFGDIGTVLEEPFESFDEFHYIDRETYEAITDLDETVSDYREQLRRAIEDGIEVIPLSDGRYPKSIRHHNSPVVLFARGDPSLLTDDSISFAGSREANDVALEWTKTTAARLAQEDFVIVSGGALGIDSAAHHGALEAGGVTIAVLAGGPDHRYPEEHEDLFDQIQANGLLLWQQPPGQSPTRYDFLERNKTNSALSQAIVIAAAGISGGSMSQYEDAKKQGTDVLVPESTLEHEPGSGLKEILAEDGATPVHSADDILQQIAESGNQSTLGDWKR